MKLQKVEVWQVGNGEWMWHALARNGNILADSGESYKTKVNCFKAMEAVTDATNRGIKVVELEQQV